MLSSYVIQCYKVETIIIALSQKWKLRHSEVEYLAHGHTVRKRQDSGSDLCDSKASTQPLHGHREFKCPYNPTSFISHISLCSSNKPCTFMHVSLCFCHSLHVAGPFPLFWLTKSCQPLRLVT